MFALLSVIECPGCGESVPLVAMNLFDDSDLIVMQCPKFGLDIQIQHSKADEFIVEPLKKC